jgi:hypothetical protein
VLGRGSDVGLLGASGPVASGRAGSLWPRGRATRGTRSAGWGVGSAGRLQARQRQGARSGLLGRGAGPQGCRGARGSAGRENRGEEGERRERKGVAGGGGGCAEGAGRGLGKERRRPAARPNGPARVK